MAQMSLFDFDSDNNMTDSRKSIIRKVQYISTEKFDYNTLFSGFDRLRVITFSYDLYFINKIAKKFKKVEIIFGCDALVNYDLNVILANQIATIENIRKYKELTKRVQDGEIEFYVSEKIASHSKIYILDNIDDEDDMKNRIITGSSNFSNRGMNGYQLEDNVYYENDINAYLDYDAEYENFKSTCKNNLIKKSLLVSEKDIQIKDVPSIQNALENNTSIIVDEVSDPEEAEYKIITDKYAGTLEDFKFEKDNNQKIQFIKPKKLSTLIARKKKQDENQKAKRNDYAPITFKIDYDNNTVMFNDKNMNLEVTDDEVKNGINTLNEYFEGFNTILVKGNHHNVKDLKREYFKLMNYMFVTPFISELRYKAFMATDGTTIGLNYPMYVVINGYKNCGKTTFLRNMYKFMTNENICMLTADNYTTTSLKSIIENHKGGVPIVFDEIDKSRFRDHQNYTKVCDNLPGLGIKHHPCFILTSNTINSIDSDILKRVILFNIYGQFDQDEIFKNYKKYDKIAKNIDNSFYKRYLFKMIPLVNDALYDMEENSEYVDIFTLSSKVIFEIFNECGIEIPDYFYEISRIDYIGEKVSGARALEALKTSWENEKENFIINKKTGTVLYTAQTSFEARNIYNELPAKVNCVITGKTLSMNKNALEEYLDETLYIGWFEQRRLRYKK